MDSRTPQLLGAAIFGAVLGAVVGISGLALLSRALAPGSFELALPFAAVLCALGGALILIRIVDVR